MEQSQALHKLLESADLIKLVEEITSLGTNEKLSNAALAGMRITLRTVRENILASHDRLSGNFLQSARALVDARPQVNVEGANTASTSTSMMTTTPPLASIINNATPAAAAAAVTVENGAKFEGPAIRSESANTSARTTLLADPEKLQMMRKDLRASLQKMVESR